MDKTVVSLNGGWNLAYMENSIYKTIKKPITDIKSLKKIGTHIPAEVPGDFLLELVKNGTLPRDIYFGNNVWECQKYEFTHVWYYTEFSLDEEPTERMYFDFEGLDTEAEIFLNGTLVGVTDNMFIPHTINHSGALRKGKNELVVHFTPVMLSERPRLPLMCNTVFYNFEALYTRKPMHSYGWDIMPRVLSCGIWKPVYLKEQAKDSIAELYLYTLKTEPENDYARVRVYFALDISADDPREYRFTVDGVCGDSAFHDEVCPRHTEYTRLAFGIKNCKLWWPRNQGAQNLYDVEARLWHGDELCDVKKIKLGIRTVELDRTDAVKDGKGEFCFKINGRKVFCLGTNWVPLSPFHCEDAERLPKALDKLYESGCNMVRVWGGGVYPDEKFYNFCDENGIMVWQDFAMACAVYPQDEIFRRKIEEEATDVVKSLRQHPSLVLWAGDNECDCTCRDWTGFKRDPNGNVLTRKIIPEVLRFHDFTRPYLPSSPYISPEAHAFDLPTPEAHLWGERTWFKSEYYSDPSVKFASEVGYIGLPARASLEKFIGEDYLFPNTDEDGMPNVHWLAHTSEAQDDGEISYRYRFFLPIKEVKYLFGYLPNDLDSYIAATQISQGEALKYFIECFRTKKWNRTGILWWNLLDGWPQVSDAAVDWYFNEKLAFKLIKRSQAPVCLMFDEPHDGKITLIGANDTESDAVVLYKVTRISDGATVAAGEIMLSSNENLPLCSVDCNAAEYEMYFIEWTANGKEYKNHYVTGHIGMSAERYLCDLNRCGIETDLLK